MFEGQVNLNLGCKNDMPFRFQNHVDNQEEVFKSFDVVLFGQDLAKF